MLRVGLTGGIASGKSTVADLLAGHGAVIIDADLLAREVVQPGTPGLAAIVQRFGPSVLASDGSLDRGRLGELVFDDAAARAALNAIVHPAVRALAVERERRAPADAIVVHVIPLLVETGQQGAFDVVVVVDVDPEAQIDRLIGRNGFSRAQAEARLAAQAGRGQRLAAADRVIANAGTLAELRSAVDSLWRELGARRSASSA
jgi:dephospho-CoA kinase